MQSKKIGLLAGMLCCAMGAASAGELASFKTLRLEGNGVRWHTPAGKPGPVVTYSVVAQEMEFAGARNCGRMTAPTALLSGSHIAPDRLRQEVAAAFAMWEAVADISFREAAGPDRADILIGAQLEPEGWAFANVFYDTLSPEVVKPISRALVCLNPEKRWKIGFDGDLKAYDLRYTLAHEIGHAIGLDHPSGGGQIMGYRYEETFRGLQPGDIAGAVTLYGNRGPSGIVAASKPAEEQRSPPVAPGAEGGGERAFPAQ